MSRRLYRSRGERMIAGVAGGLAEVDHRSRNA
ncbi:MAG: PspC domain-containing protein [Chloroflexota bacterium]